MSTAALSRPLPIGRVRPAIDVPAVSAWVLSLSFLLGLGFNGGGYAMSAYGQAGIAVWWVVTICCAWGLLPRTSLTRTGLAVMLVFGAFCGWTALGVTWSISSGRSFADLAQVTTYFGVLVLGVAIHRERGEAVRHTQNAVATAIVVIAAVAVATRLYPDLIPSARTFQGAIDRLAWPLDYWNALASLTVMGLPLLLSAATSARRLTSQAAAAAAIPVVVLCGALTQSRGGLIAAGAALVVWLLCVPERIPKLSTGALVAAGSTAVVAAAFHDRTIRLAQTGALERHQAGHLLVGTLLVIAGVGVAQLGIARVLRHTVPPGAISPPRRTAAALFSGTLVVLIVVAVAAGVPHKLDHVWQDFKNPVSQTPNAAHLVQTSGEGRYQYWVAGADAARGHQLIGTGPGTFQLDWLPRARIYSYVTNAHSLYVETYTELGFVGLALLALFILGCLLACVRAMMVADALARTRAAGVTAVIVAFFVGAAFDWLWQVPTLVGVPLLLISAILTRPLTPSVRAEVAARPGGSARLRRLGGVVFTLLGLAALVAVAYPLSVDSAITRSQHAADAGQLPAAVSAARQAVALEPGSGEAQIQLALALEQARQFTAAQTAARRAVTDEPENWTNWLTLSRLDAERGQARASLAAFLHARSLNPQSTVFTGS